MCARWLGIDFSGDFQQWSARRSKSNVWVARVEDSNGLALEELTQIQSLPGDGTPFDRLVALLSKREFDAAAIDAPFSVPQEYVPSGDHAELLNLVSRIPCEDNRPFPSGKAFREAVVKEGPPLSSPKPWRRTDCYWRCKGVNVRSTLWNGVRPGAPMTAACLTLLYRSGCPIWPWSNSSKKGLLVEAFPAAQLRTWSMKFERYNGSSSERQEIREEIVDAVVKRVKVSLDFIKKMRESADALDAVVCCFAAIAVTRDQVACPPQYPEACREGGISVMRDDGRWHQG
jgi:predicted nuclease with RNAse H fold